MRFGPSIGATTLGGTIYELPKGQSICPYHYEYGNEEWVMVLDGRPTLRHPEGEEELVKHEPSVAVYPDSDKIGVRPGDKRDHILVRRESVVDYWDRET